MRAFLAALLLIAVPVAALADQCLAPPVLNNPRTCNVPVGGGICSFAYSEDGIVAFPDQVVTGPVTIEGGRTVYVGPGHIRLQNNEHYAVAFNSPTNVFVEGLYADANGYCDVFAVRNHREHQIAVTFQNVYAAGPTYNNPNVGDGKCHGDLIQYQPPKSGAGGGMALTVENFEGTTNAQGFFIPGRGTGDFSADLRNVYIRRETTSNYKPLIWLSSDHYGDPAYPAVLDNVHVDFYGLSQILPEDGVLSDGVVTFPPDDLIQGSINKGAPTDVDSRPFVGLNYDRAAFCGGEPAPEPDPAPAPPPGPVADATPPAVEIRYPSGWVQKNSIVGIEVYAVDDALVREIRVFVNGSYIDTVYVSGQEGGGAVDWIVRGNGRKGFTIEAMAIDDAGNFATHQITVFATK